MTRTITTDERFAALESKLSRMADALAIFMEAQDKVAPTIQHEPMPESTDGEITLIDGLSIATVKEHAKRKGQNIMGKVNQKRYSQWVALYQSDHSSPSQYVAQQAAKVSSNGSDPWAEFSRPERSAESQWGRPKAAEASESYRNHPERSTVESMSQDKLFLFAQAGKPTAKIADFRRVPLNGNHRRCIGLLARGTDTDSVKLVVAEAVTIAKSVPAAARYF